MPLPQLQLLSYLPSVTQSDWHTPLLDIMHAAAASVLSASLLHTHRGGQCVSLTLFVSDLLTFFISRMFYKIAQKTQLMLWIFGFIRHPADEESQQIRHSRSCMNTERTDAAAGACGFRLQKKSFLFFISFRGPYWIAGPYALCVFCV